MYRYKKMLYRYSIDKLQLKYFDDGYISVAIKGENSKLFLFERIERYLRYEVYEVYYKKDDELCNIGILSFKEKGVVILEVANKLLYTSTLEFIKIFESEYGLRFKTFSKIELCCDSNVNLPYKLDRTLHSTKYKITRCNRDSLTKNGNLRIGGKYIENLVTLNKDSKDKKAITYYYAPVRTHGCKKGQYVQLVGYDKKKEIEEKEAKYYILDGLAFAMDSVYRLEIRTCGFEMKQFGIDLQTLYDNLSDMEHWKNLFLSYINRFFEFHDGKRKFTVSEILGIE